MILMEAYEVFLMESARWCFSWKVHDDVSHGKHTKVTLMECGRRWFSRKIYGIHERSMTWMVVEKIRMLWSTVLRRWSDVDFIRVQKHKKMYAIIHNALLWRF